MRAKSGRVLIQYAKGTALAQLEKCCFCRVCLSIIQFRARRIPVTQTDAAHGSEGTREAPTAESKGRDDFPGEALWPV